MGKMQREKGARFERELSNALRAEGYETHRTAQYAGNSGQAADVVGLPGIHIEAKRQEQIRIYDWMMQAKRDATEAGNGDFPTVFFRKSGEEILVCMRFQDWIQIYKEWEAGLALNEKK